jgi:hypothetical protein
MILKLMELYLHAVYAALVLAMMTACLDYRNFLPYVKRGGDREPPKEEGL